ncbi:MAG: S49 family peptidase [Burkholderiaceae bacterium]|jgi:protease-4
MPEENTIPGFSDPDRQKEPRFSPDVPPTERAQGAQPWERSVLEELAFGSLRERRSARRWGIFFKSVTLFYVTLVLLYLGSLVIKGSEADLGSRHTALVSMEGVIDTTGQASAEKVNGALQTAFHDSGTAGVILRINSPGGSPVQAGMIYDEIKRLRGEYPNKPLYVVVEEICASGGYYTAAAADEIFVDKASIVGSIGVLMDGFGFTGTMEKVGVERRLMTAGKNKGIGDPFSPMTEEQKAHLQGMLDEIHEQFIKVVRDGRGKRLKETPDLFSGLFWSGAKSIELGLADGYGTVDSVARDVIKAQDVVDYTEKESLPERVARRIGSSFAGSLARALTTPLGWR